MERLLNQLGNVITVVCGLSCTCVIVLFIGGGLVLRTAGMGLFTLLGDLVLGRTDTTPTRRTQAPLPRPTSGAALRTRSQSVDFDAALRQQGAAPMPMTIQAQSAAFPPQAQVPTQGFPGQTPSGYANTPLGYPPQTGGFGATLQEVPPRTAPTLPTAGTITPLQDNRVLQPQEMRAPAMPLPNQPYPNQPYPNQPYPNQPLGGAPVVPSLSGQAPVNPGYQPLAGGYQQQAAPADPNAFFPPPQGGIPRRASLSAGHDVSAGAMGMDDFDAANYPGLRNRRRRGAGQEIYDDTPLRDGEEREGGIGGIIGDLGNMIGL